MAGRRLCANMTSKQRWRKRLLQKVIRVPKQTRLARSRKICAGLHRLIRRLKPATVFAFAPTPFEPNLWPFYAALWKKGARIAFPKVRGRSLHYYMVSAKRQLAPGTFHILEPVPSCRKIANPRRGDAILVPCVGLSTDGHRLGHGGGYFDRWLARNTRAARIAVLFRLQRNRHVPYSDNDAVIQYSVSEIGVG